MESSVPSGLAWLGGLGNIVIDLLFPPSCVVCHRLGAWLCAQCMDEIEVIRPPVCSQCGLPLDVALSPYSAPSDSALYGETASVLGASPTCLGCRNAISQLDGLRACAFHRGPLRLAIHQFKYEGLRSLAVPLGELMGCGWATLATDDASIDVVVPVPLHAARLRGRGFNQAALLAHEMGRHLGRPVVEDVLIRSRATAPQVGLDANERWGNVAGAFECTRSSLAGTSVLLVDDVCTTGSTLDAACAALREGGVRSVWAFTLARAG
jgi:ComF family protein